MFELHAKSEVTQVDFWTLYRDVFTPHGLTLGASEVIKNVTVLRPEAIAMVLPLSSLIQSILIFTGIITPPPLSIYARLRLLALGVGLVDLLLRLGIAMLILLPLYMLLDLRRVSPTIWSKWPQN